MMELVFLKVGDVFELRCGTPVVTAVPLKMLADTAIGVLDSEVVQAEVYPGTPIEKDGMPPFRTDYLFGFYVVELAEIEPAGECGADSLRIQARRLRTVNEWDPEGPTIRFYQGGILSPQYRTPFVVGAMRRIISFEPIPDPCEDAS